MNSSYNKKTITTQPIVSHLDTTKTTKSKINNINPHKNSCEKFCTCNSTGDRCPVNCQEFGKMFKLYEDNHGREFGFYSCVCLPVTLPINTLMCGPCTLYNMCRNACDENKENKNYVC